MGRFITGAGYSGSIGGNITVNGTAERQTITVADVAGTVTFDASFNRGGDTIVLTKPAASYTITQSGSTVILSDGDSRIVIPVGTVANTIQFSDGDRALLFSSGVKIGSQALTSTATTVTAEGAPKSALAADAASQAARLVLNDESAWVGGNATVYGSTSAETVNVLDYVGKITLDPSFNRGGDMLKVDAAATNFTATRSGSTIVLASSGKEYVVPIGTVGMDIDFGGDARTVQFSDGNFKVGDQLISATSAALSGSERAIFQGTVYKRADNIVYSPSDVGSIRLNSVSVAAPSMVKGVETDPTGNFNIQLKNSSSIETIKFSEQGYQEMFFFSSLYKNPTADMNVGLYPTQIVTPRPDFIKSIGIIDGGGWQVDSYQKGFIKTTIDRIVNVDHGNTVLIQDPIIIQSIDKDNNIKMGYSVPKAEYWRMLNAAEYTDIVNYAHQKGLKFTLELGTLLVNLENTFANDNYFQTPLSNIAFWNNFFLAYKESIIPYVQMAKELNIEYLDISPGPDEVMELPIGLWNDLIGSIRGTGYSGKLIYSSRFEQLDKLVSQKVNIDEFVNLFDIIQIKFISVDNDTMASGINRLSISEMENIFEEKLSIISHISKPIMINADFPSVVGATDNQQFVDQIINQNAPSPPRDLFAQSDIFESLFRAINSFPADNNEIIGFVPTHYAYIDDLFSYTYGDSITTVIQDDKSCSIRGKPAEAVLAYWYQSWA